MASHYTEVLSMNSDFAIPRLNGTEQNSICGAGAVPLDCAGAEVAHSSAIPMIVLHISRKLSRRAREINGDAHMVTLTGEQRRKPNPLGSRRSIPFPARLHSILNEGIGRVSDSSGATVRA